MEFELYYHAIGEDDLTAKEHTHVNRMEVIHIVNGSGTILLGENTYPFAPNDVFCFDGSLLHYILPNDRKIYERNKLIYEKSMMSLLVDETFGKQSYFHADTTLSAEIDGLFRAIENHQMANEPLLAVSSIFQLLHICQKENSSLVPSESRFLHQIMNYINTNLQETLSTDTLAHHIHMSKYYMCRRFKEETGITIGNYIKMQRLYLAKKRLEETNDSISEIALGCGFGDLAHFTKFFKSIVKVTPSAYRKQFRR